MNTEPTTSSPFDGGYLKRLYPQESSFDTLQIKSQKGQPYDRFIVDPTVQQREFSQIFKERLSAEAPTLDMRSERIFEAVTGYEAKSYPRSYFRAIPEIDMKEKLTTKYVQEGLLVEQQLERESTQRKVSQILKNIPHTESGDRRLPNNFYSHDTALGRSDEIYCALANKITHYNLNDFQERDIHTDEFEIRTLQTYEEGTEHLLFGSFTQDNNDKPLSYNARLLDFNIGRIAANFILPKDHSDSNTEYFTTFTSSGANIMYMGTTQGNLYLHDKRSRHFYRFLTRGTTDEEPRISSMSLSARKTALAVSTEGGEVMIYDTRQLKKDYTHRFKGANSALRGLTWSPDSKRIFTGGASADKLLRIFDIQNPSIPVLESWYIGSPITGINFLTDTIFNITGSHIRQLWQYKDNTCKLFGHLGENVTWRELSSFYLQNKQTLVTVEHDRIHKWNIGPLIAQVAPTEQRVTNKDQLIPGFSLR